MPKTTAGYVGLFFGLLTVATIVGISLKAFGVLSWGWGVILAPWLFTCGALFAFIILVVLMVGYVESSLESDDDDM